MPLSPEMYKGHERAHELVTQWRKNGYANGSGSDNIKMFEYLIHMEDEVENLMSDAPRPVAMAAGSVGDSKLQSRITELEGQLQIAQAGGPAKPQTTSAAVKTVLADLETAEERIAALEQENNELRARPVESEDSKVLKYRVAELETMLTKGHDAAEKLLDALTVVPTVRLAEDEKPVVVGPPPVTEATSKVDKAPAAKSDKVTDFKRPEPKPPAATPVTSSDAADVVVELSNIVKPWKKGISVREQKGNLVFTQAGEDYITLKPKGDNWAVAKSVSTNPVFKRTAEAIKHLLV